MKRKQPIRKEDPVVTEIRAIHEMAKEDRRVTGKKRSYVKKEDLTAAEVQSIHEMADRHNRRCLGILDEEAKRELWEDEQSAKTYVGVEETEEDVFSRFCCGFTDCMLEPDAEEAKSVADDFDDWEEYEEEFLAEMEERSAAEQVPVEEFKVPAYFRARELSLHSFGKIIAASIIPETGEILLHRAEEWPVMPIETFKRKDAVDELFIASAIEDSYGNFPVKYRRKKKVSYRDGRSTVNDNLKTMPLSKVKREHRGLLRLIKHEGSALCARHYWRAAGLIPIAALINSLR